VESDLFPGYEKIVAGRAGGRLVGWRCSYIGYV